MTKILTENDNFDADITVPLGSDTHATLAEFIESIAQKLTNRSLWLKKIVERSNTWLAEQLFNVGLNPDTAMLRSVRSPADCNVTGTPEPTNPWRMFAEFPSGITDVNVRIYWGGGLVEGYLCVSFNAYWRPQNQRWRQEDAGNYSFAFMVGGIGTQFLSKDPASADWLTADWDKTLSEVHAHSFHAAGTLNAVNECNASNFNYNSSQARKEQLPLSSAFGPVDADALRVNNRIQFDSGLSSGALATGIKWPIPILPDGTIGTITVVFSITNAGDSFQWHRRRQLDDHTVSYTTVGSALLTDGVNMAYKTINPPSGIQDGDEYELVWKLQNSADAGQVTGNRVYGLRRDYIKYGPG